MEFVNLEKLRIRHLIRSFHCWSNLGFYGRVVQLSCSVLVQYVSSMGFVFTNDFTPLHRVGFRRFFAAIGLPSWFAHSCTLCGDVPAGRSFHRPIVQFEKIEISKLGKVKKGNRKGWSSG